MRVGTSITSCSRSYVGLQANNMDERTPDSKRIGECLTLNFLIMKKHDKLFEAFKKQSDGLNKVSGGRRFARPGITHRPEPTHYRKGDTWNMPDQE